MFELNETFNVAAEKASSRLVIAAVVVPSVVALSFAFAAEFLLRTVGCELCIYEREPYAFAAGLGVLAVLGRASPSLLRLLFMICAALFAIGGGLAALHVATQQGWSFEAAVCSQPPGDQALLDLIAVVAERARRLGCDETEWSLFDVSLAGWNLAYSTFLSLVCVGLSIYMPRDPTTAPEIRTPPSHVRHRAGAGQQAVWLSALIALGLLLASVERSFDTVRRRTVGDVRLVLKIVSTSPPALRYLLVKERE